MSGMVEKIAKAIAYTDGWREPFIWHELQREVYFVRARAAIEAMREPTKEMIIAGNDKIEDCIDSWNYDSDSGYSVGTEAAFSCLNAMIDDALTE